MRNLPRQLGRGGVRRQLRKSRLMKTRLRLRLSPSQSLNKSLSLSLSKSLRASRLREADPRRR